MCPSNLPSLYTFFRLLVALSLSRFFVALSSYLSEDFGSYFIALRPVEVELFAFFSLPMWSLTKWRRPNFMHTSKYRRYFFTPACILLITCSLQFFMLAHTFKLLSCSLRTWFTSNEQLFDFRTRSKWRHPCRRETNVNKAPKSQIGGSNCCFLLASGTQALSRLPRS